MCCHLVMETVPPAWGSVVLRKASQTRVAQQVCTSHAGKKCWVCILDLHPAAGKCLLRTLKLHPATPDGSATSHDRTDTVKWADSQALVAQTGVVSSNSG
mmetsp:Transcript_119243/g.222991  ORF Transcript_119243/g.222991 Transcript_119243/m.222991 type:complete len:100 (+) Transcript_119243:757-1056(+)